MSDGHYEYRVLHGPACRVVCGWTFPSADASALLGAWARDGFRYGSTRLALKWGVAYVALRDPAAEDEADAWYAALAGENSAPPP